MVSRCYISKEGVDFQSLDNAPVHGFTIVSGARDCNYHLQVIKPLTSLIQHPDFLKNPFPFLQKILSRRASFRATMENPVAKLYRLA